MKAIYIRTSSTEQTPELQLADIRTICSDPDVKIFREQQSAWKENSKRPVFDELQKLISKGKVCDIYVWDLDRLFRNRLRLKEFFALCQQNNCVIHSFNQQWLETINSIPAPFNDIVKELLTSVFGWIGQEESSKKSLRVKMACVKNNKDGLTYSYKGAKWGRKAFPKQTIDRVLALHNEGKSIRQIAELVMVYDKHKNSRNISKSAVHKILAKKSR